MSRVRDEQLLTSIRAGDRAALSALAELIREAVRELDIPGVSEARGRLDSVIRPLHARMLVRIHAPDFQLRGSLRGYVMTFVALRRDELEPGAAPTGLRRLERANPDQLAGAVDQVLHKLTEAHSPDVRELAQTWLALVDEGAAIDVRSGHETARMLKTASPTLARKSDNDFHGALRAFRTMLGFELAKLGF